MRIAPPLLAICCVGEATLYARAALQLLAAPRYLGGILYAPGATALIPAVIAAAYVISGIVTVKRPRAGAVLSTATVSLLLVIRMVTYTLVPSARPIRFALDLALKLAILVIGIAMIAVRSTDA